MHTHTHTTSEIFDCIIAIYALLFTYMCIGRRDSARRPLHHKPYITEARAKGTYDRLFYLYSQEQQYCGISFSPLRYVGRIVHTTTCVVMSHNDTRCRVNNAVCGNSGHKL